MMGKIKRLFLWVLSLIVALSIIEMFKKKLGLYEYHQKDIPRRFIHESLSGTNIKKDPSFFHDVRPDGSNASANSFTKTPEKPPDSDNPDESDALPTTVPDQNSDSIFTGSDPGPTLLVILTYQRSGSTFFGNLFDRNPGDFFVFEPLDSLYTAMYGVREGWNVPSDIMNWKSGSIRSIPPVEQQAIAKYLGDLLSCNFEAMPSEFLFRHFWTQFSGDQTEVNSYVNCLKKKNLIKLNDDCRGLLSKTCPRRFGADLQKQTHCRDVLWNTTSNSGVHNMNQSKDNPFSMYFDCQRSTRSKAPECIDKLTELCKQSTIRSAKTVRLTMESVEGLIEAIPNIRIIHLIRDPRAVAVSRYNYWGSAQGLYSGKNMVKEAETFCRNLVKDITIRKELEFKYPDTFMEVLYDDFVFSPLDNSERVYDFLKAEMSQVVQDWLVENTQKSKNSTKIASKWRKSLKGSNLDKVNAACQEFFDLVSYDWK